MAQQRATSRGRLAGLVEALTTTGLRELDARVLKARSLSSPFSLSLSFPLTLSFHRRRRRA